MSAISTALKRSKLALALVAGLAAAGAAGSAHAHSANVRLGVGIVFAPHAPPPPRHEYIPRHHARNAFWQQGHWQWTGHRWRWVPGHYVRAPRRGAHWSDGRWEHRGGRYYWRDGRWH